MNFVWLDSKNWFRELYLLSSLPINLDHRTLIGKKYVNFALLNVVSRPNESFPQVWAVSRILYNSSSMGNLTHRCQHKMIQLGLIVNDAVNLISHQYVGSGVEPGTSKHQLISPMTSLQSTQPMYLVITKCQRRVFEKMTCYGIDSMGDIFINLTGEWMENELNAHWRSV